MSNSGKTSNKRTLVGFVVSDKNDKTIVVRVETLVKHPVLKNISAAERNSWLMTPTMNVTLGIKFRLSNPAL